MPRDEAAEIGKLVRGLTFLRPVKRSCQGFFFFFGRQFMQYQDRFGFQSNQPVYSSFLTFVVSLNLNLKLQAPILAKTFHFPFCFPVRFFLYSYERETTWSLNIIPVPADILESLPILVHATSSKQIH